MIIEFKQVAVIGAGAMGRGIAQIAAQAGSQVWLYDTQAQACLKAQDAVGQMWDTLQAKGRLSADSVVSYKSRLQIKKVITFFINLNINRMRITKQIMHIPHNLLKSAHSIPGQSLEVRDG